LGFVAPGLLHHLSVFDRWVQWYLGAGGGQVGLVAERSGVVLTVCGVNALGCVAGQMGLWVWGCNVVTP